jgi:hypothetical protein
MITVVHAFPESSQDSQEMHLRYWYGTVRPDAEENEDPDEPVVCWCGGKHVSIGPNTVAVWHLQHWHEWA